MRADNRSPVRPGEWRRGSDGRQVVGMVGMVAADRTAQHLWDALPDEYQGGAVAAPDVLAADRAVVPADRIRTILYRVADA